MDQFGLRRSFKMDDSLEYTLKKIPRPARAHCRALGHMLMAQVKEKGLTDSEMKNRMELIEFLNEELSKSFMCKVTLFGSSTTSLGFTTSDINGSVFFDLNKVTTVNNLDVNGNTEVQVGPRNDPDVLNRLMYFFTSHPRFSTPELLFKSNTAEIHVRSTRMCDSFSNIILNWQYQIGIETSHLLAEYVKLNPVLRPLVIVFREWAKICKIHAPESPGLDSISYVVIAIFFLQKLKLLPVIKLPFLKNSFDPPSYFEIPPEKVGFLWLRLLRFYAVEFDFKEYVVAITEENNRRSDNSLIYIQDPLKPSANLVKDENGPATFEQIIECIKSTYFYFAIPRTIHGSLYDRILPPEDENTWENWVFHRFVKSCPNSPWTPLDELTSEKWNPLTLAEIIKGENWRDFQDFKQFDLESIKVRMNSTKIYDSKTLTSVLSDDVTLLSDIFLDWFYFYDFKEVSFTQFVRKTIPLPRSISTPKPPVVLPGKAVMPPSAPFILGPFAGQPLLQYLQQPFVPPPGTHIQSIGPVAMPTFIPPFGSVPPTIIRTQAPLLNPMQPLLPGPRPLMQIPALNVNHPKIQKTVKPGLLGKSPATVLPQAVVKPRTVSANVTLPPVPLNEDLIELNNIMYKNLEMEGLTENDNKIRQNIVKELKQILSATYPTVEFKMFGSSCNGFGTRHSDMDISASFGIETSSMDQRTTLKQIAKILKNYHLKFSDVTFIDATVPIVKFYHLTYNLEGDISVENRLAVANTKLLKTYADIDPRVKVLGSFVKSVTKMCDISDASAGGLSSYGFTLMVIYYLQQMEPPVLPVLQELCLDTVEPARVGNWDVRFYQNIKNLPKVWSRHGHNKMSVGELWLGFLHYYVEVFDFDQLVISIRNCSPITKDFKRWPKVKKRFLAIEDPFDLSRNLAKHLSRKMCDYIMSVFDYMLEACYSKCVSNQILNTYESWRNDGDVFLLEGHPLYKPPKPRKPKKQKTPEEIAARKKRLLERKIRREQERLQKLQNNNKKD